MNQLNSNSDSNNESKTNVIQPLPAPAGEGQVKAECDRAETARLLEWVKKGEEKPKPKTIDLN